MPASSPAPKSGRANASSPAPRGFQSARPGASNASSPAGPAAVTPAKKRVGPLGAKIAPEPLSQALARFKSYQSGLKLGAGYQVGQQISGGAEGDVHKIGRAGGHRADLAVKRIRVANASTHKHIVQEITAVFSARALYAEEVEDATADGHPNIVTYVDWFAGPQGLDREVLIVMERCDFTLNDVIYTAGQLRSQYDRHISELKKAPVAGNGKRPVPVSDPLLYRFTEKEVIKVLENMLSALTFLNRHGILHRDIKPDNILWRADVPDSNYKLADFGTAACLREGECGRKAEDCGTLWTMAPEILGRRTHGPNCDVWSLGVVLFELATLEKPFNSKELLAFRHSCDAAVEGNFWTTICAASTTALNKANPSPSSPRLPSLPSRSTPTVARTASLSKSAGRPRLERGYSVPALSASPGAASSSSSPCPARKLSTLGVLPLQKAAASADIEDEILSPKSASNLRRTQKYTFLRKRGGGRWAHSEDLQTLIFEDMLEECGSIRAASCEVFALPKVQELIARRQSPESPSVAASRRSSISPGGDAESGSPAPPGDFSSALGGPAGCDAGALAVQVLRRVTGEHFMMAVHAEREALRAARPAPGETM